MAITSSTNVLAPHSSIAADGYVIMEWIQAVSATLIVNILEDPTGTTPGITFTMETLDPGDNLTPLGTSADTGSLTGIDTSVITMALTQSPSLKISWALVDPDNEFPNVNILLYPHHFLTT